MPKSFLGRFVIRWCLLGAALGIVLSRGQLRADDSVLTKVFEGAPPDPRLKPLRTYNDEYHPWVPPQDLNTWQQTQEQLRERILVSCGLWPLPEKTPLAPVVHGTVDRGDYLVDKVFFASRPGHYVSGSLYRPKKLSGKSPGVLCPHGHWPNGRFYDAGEKVAAESLQNEAETHLAGARSAVQARMVQLARMGCIVFHYDMIGNADSVKLEHREGFTDAAAELWLHNRFGLQTWNSMRALDFLLSLPDVDPARIGVTGASGGGTQTFVLCAVDPRPTVAFPAVMVGTAMQGGCQCENASYMRHGINNVAFASCFAPKPLAMSGAQDWTINVETRGLPEIRSIYRLYGQPDLVKARTWPQYGHNYNQHAREMMYEWFNSHLNLGQKSPIIEQDFWPMTKEEISVYDSEHPLPSNALPLEALRERMVEETRATFAKLVPSDAAGIANYRKVVGSAATVMFCDGVPPEADCAGEITAESTLGDVKLYRGWCGRKAKVQFRGNTSGLPPAAGRDFDGERIPIVALIPPQFSGRVVLWLDGKGKSHLLDSAGQPEATVRKLLDSGRGVVSADLFFTGELRPTPDGKNFTETGYAVDAKFPGYTYCYNRPVLSERVRDVLAVIAALRTRREITQIDLVGTGAAGLWAALASAQTGSSVGSVAADLQGFSFGKLTDVRDPNFLPGALRYGGLGGLMALGSAPTTLYGCSVGSSAELTSALAIAAWQSRSFSTSGEPLSREAVATLLRK